tara:strand:- start:3541 stop:5253 length:1713 start_codon:yes stop_codon:yes gene_type:complete
MVDHSMLETELSAHTHALRTLARLLVGDGAAEDLVQDTALVALRSPPAEISGLRGWLSQVLRRLARNHKRGEARRQRRERQTAPRPPEDAAARVAEHHEAVHRMTATLLDLPEPYHSTLLLRFFEELTPTVIAEQTGVPLATVKSRLKRGLKLLRERLDEQVKGEDWRPVLAVTFGLPHAGKAATAATATVTTVTAGILAMASTTKFSITVVAAVVIALALAIWAGQAFSPIRPSPQMQGEPASGSYVAYPQAGSAASLVERVVVPGSEDWLFRVIDQQSGGGIVGAEVFLVEGVLEAAYSKDQLKKLGVTGAGGEFTSPSGGVSLDGFAVIASSSTHLPRAIEVGPPGAYEVSLRSGALVKVRVEDTSGDPVEGAMAMAYSSGADAGLVLGTAVSKYELSLFPHESICASATVGDDGEASLLLPHGSFSVCAQADGYFMLDPPKAVTAQSGSGSLTTVVLGELRGCVLALPPHVDGVLALRARLRRGAWANSPVMFANITANSQRESWQSEFPRHVVVVMPCVNQSGKAGDSAVDLSLLIDGVGSQCPETGTSLFGCELVTSKPSMTNA